MTESSKSVFKYFTIILDYSTTLKGAILMQSQSENEPILCEAHVGFIEGKISVTNIPEQIISDISISLKTSEEAFSQASRYVKLDEPYHFIVEPGNYALECHLDQVKLKTRLFSVKASERKVINFHFINHG